MTFGDFDADDAFDREPPDPEQVARKLHALRRQLDATAPPDLSDDERRLAVAVAAALVAWLTRQGALG